MVIVSDEINVHWPGSNSSDGGGGEIKRLEV